MQAQNEAHQKIENAAEDLPVQGLALGLSFSAQPARADRDIGALLECLEKFRRFLDGRRQVGIAEDKNVVLRALNMPLRTLYPLP